MEKQDIINFALEAVTRHDFLAETNTSGPMFKSDDRWLTIDELFDECLGAKQGEVLANEKAEKFDKHSDEAIREMLLKEYEEVTRKNKEMDLLIEKYRAKVLLPNSPQETREGKITVALMRDLMAQVEREEISYSRMVEILNGDSQGNGEVKQYINHSVHQAIDIIREHVLSTMKIPIELQDALSVVNHKIIDNEK